MYSDGLLKSPIFIIQKNFKILLTVYSLSPKHGYAVMQFIEEKTGGRLSLGAGTLKNVSQCKKISMKPR